MCKLKIKQLKEYELQINKLWELVKKTRHNPNEKDKEFISASIVSMQSALDIIQENNDVPQDYQQFVKTLTCKKALTTTGMNGIFTMLKLLQAEISKK